MEMNPATGYKLRCNSASIIKIRFFDLMSFHQRFVVHRSWLRSRCVGLEHGFSIGGELSTCGEFRVFRWGIERSLKNNTVLSPVKKCPGISLPTVKTFFFAELRFLPPNFDLV